MAALIYGLVRQHWRMPCAAGSFQRPETVTCKSVGSALDADLAMMQGNIVESYAAFASNCSGSPLMLSTGPGDWTVPDFIQAYEDKNQREPIAQPIQFPGPILALWPSEDGKTCAGGFAESANGSV